MNDPFSCPNSSGTDQLLGNRRAVHLSQESLPAAQAVAVNRACDQFLADAALTLDQDQGHGATPGESGVGKELVARTIHRNSPRSRERFVQVNCAAIPEELIESELFGHEKARSPEPPSGNGKFEQADHGDDLPRRGRRHEPKTQAKVLRVLQEGEWSGWARQNRPVDVRVIAATNKNLDRRSKRATSGGFYFRLAVIPIDVPPLRERPRRHSDADQALPGPH